MEKALGKKPPEPDYDELRMGCASCRERMIKGGDYCIRHERETMLSEMEHYRQALTEAADECDSWGIIRGDHPEVFVALARKLRISAGKDL